MTEAMKPPSTELLPLLAHEVFSRRLDEHALAVNEVAGKREAIEQAGIAIINEFDIEPSLFEDEGRSFVFTAIAERLATDPCDKEFLADATALLAYKHSPKLADLSPIMEPDIAEIDEQQKKAVHDKYTHKQLSGELTQAIENGLLDGVKTRMGITPFNEEPFDVKVLTIDKSNEFGFGTDSIGIETPLVKWEDIPGQNTSEKGKLAVEQDEHRRFLNSYKQDLIKRADEMEAELRSPIARAWVIKLGPEGRRTLCVSMPLAEKLLTPEITKGAAYYTEDDWRRDLAAVEHEYVHTQAGLHVDQDIYFGIGLEERRAEHFSGNRQAAYWDIKGLYRDIHTASGVNISDIINKETKGGTQAEVFAGLANELGVRNTLELLLVPPRVYFTMSHKNPYQQAVVDHIGDYDGLIAHIIERSIQNGGAEEIEQRITQYAEELDKIETPEGEKSGTWILEYRRNHGLNMMTDRYKQRLAEIQAVV